MATEVDKVLAKYAGIVIGKIQKKLLAADKLATGNLYNSFKYRVVSNIATHNSGFIIVGAKYGEYVERGRRPGKYVPIKPLINWLKAKRIAVTQETAMASRRGSTRATNKPRAAARGRGAATEAMYKSAAFAISKSIFKKGIRPFNLGLGTNNRESVTTWVQKQSNFLQELATATVKDQIKKGIFK